MESDILFGRTFFFIGRLEVVLLLLPHGDAAARGGAGGSRGVSGVGDGSDDAVRLLKAGRARDTMLLMSAQKSSRRQLVLVRKRKRHH
jgi:hypothetical protein